MPDELERNLSDSEYFAKTQPSIKIPGAFVFVAALILWGVIIGLVVGVMHFLK